MIGFIFYFFVIMFKFTFYLMLFPFLLIWTFIKLVAWFMIQLQIFLGVFNAKQAMRRRGWF